MTKSKPTKTEKTVNSDVLFRTWKLTPEARSAIANIRGSRHCETNQATIDVAIANTLPTITETLLRIGCSSLAAKKQTFRLPMSPATLADLKAASEATGQDVSALFLLCMNALVSDGPKVRKTKKGAK